MLNFYYFQELHVNAQHSIVSARCRKMKMKFRSSLQIIMPRSRRTRQMLFNPNQRTNQVPCNIGLNKIARTTSLLSAIRTRPSIRCNRRTMASQTVNVEAVVPHMQASKTFINIHHIPVTCCSPMKYSNWISRFVRPTNRHRTRHHRQRYWTSAAAISSKNQISTILIKNSPIRIIV